MPVVTGNLRDITNVAMVSEQPQIVFTLNQTNMAGGVVYPSEPSVVTPASDGSFTVDLAATQDMVDTGWYTLKLQWLGLSTGAALMDFPEWQITVPRSGGVISSLLAKPGTNQRIVWESTTPPLMPRPFMLWLEQDPLQPGEKDKARLYEWRRGGWSEHGNGSWAYIADLKGAPGYSALGTGPQKDTVAAWMEGAAGANAVSLALAAVIAENIPTIDVHSLGAVGDGVADDTLPLQTAFNVAKTFDGVHVTLRAGKTYKTTDELHIYRNTSVEGNGGTIKRHHNGYLVMNGDRGASYPGYTGHGNLQLRNLVFDHNATAFNDGYGSIFTLGHAEKVLFDRVRFLNANSHAVDCSANKQVRFRDCEFLGYRNTDGNDYVEAIQIDYAVQSGFPAFGAYDGTPCRDILVDGCRFGASDDLPAHPRFIGSHGAAVGSAAEKIVITNNTFTDPTNLAVRPFNWNDVDVHNNYMAGNAGFFLANTPDGDQNWGLRVTHNTAITTGAVGIRFLGKETGTFQNCIITQNRLFGGDSGAWGGIQVAYFRSMAVTENMIRQYMGAGITCVEGTADVDLLVSGNSIHSVGQNGIQLAGITDVRVVNNETWSVGRETAGVYAHIRLTTAITNATVSGNQARASGTSTALHGFYAGSSCTGVVRIGNNWRGSATTAVADGSTGGSN